MLPTSPPATYRQVVGPIPETIYPSHHPPLHPFSSASLITFRPSSPVSIHHDPPATPQQSRLIQQRIPQRHTLTSEYPASRAQSKGAPGPVHSRRTPAKDTGPRSFGLRQDCHLSVSYQIFDQRRHCLYWGSELPFSYQHFSWVMCV